MTRIFPASLCKAPIAHRALHDLRDGRPENSRAAARAAVAVGYGIEIDIQMSADGQAMVFHDYELSRLTPARGTVRSVSAETLGEVQLIGFGGELFLGELQTQGLAQNFVAQSQGGFVFR